MNRVLFAAFACLCVIGISFYFVGTSNPTVAELNALPASHAGTVAQALGVEPPPLPAAIPAAPNSDTTDEREQDDPYANEALRAQFASIAEAYAANLPYPPTSQPIRSEAELPAFQPPPFATVEMPFPVDGQEHPVSLAIQLDRYQFFAPEPVPVAVVINGLADGATPSGRLVLTTLTGNVLSESKLSGDSKSLLTSIFDLRQQWQASWPTELQIGAYIDADSHSFFIAAPIRYEAAAATLTGIGNTTVQREYLNIPLNFEVARAGYYFVRANLYSRGTGKPLVHLEAEGKLSSNLPHLDLNAHIAALQAGGDEGPYLLKDVSISRAAGDGESLDYAGKSGRAVFAVPGQPFSNYQNIAYDDPLAKERLEFLQQLGRM